MQLLPNTTLQNGRYTITGVLGQGGFGITYRGRQSFLNRDVAIKEFFMGEYCERDADGTSVTIVTKTCRDLVDRFRVKFIKEAQLIASFNNPHIIRIYDIFEENGTAYYVMEYHKRGSLSEQVKTSGRLSADKSVTYIREVSEALSFIHKSNVLHLDIKPSNILLDDTDSAVLIDFGVSKRYDEEGGQTSSSPVGRSRGFAPLEQYKTGGVEMFTPATDIYSLGATLYYILTGEVPPEASDVMEDGLGPKPPHIPEHIWSAVTTSMSSSRKRRPQTVSDFVSMLGPSCPAVSEVKSESFGKRDVRDERTRLDDVVISEPASESGDRIFQVGGVEFKMKYVEGGTFWMGAHSQDRRGIFGIHPDTSIPNYDADACGDESPVHSVTLSSFSIGETEVTQELWEAVMGSNPSYWKGSNLPVESVSWKECQEFVSRLNAKTGACFRLPTEAEWEYAARGGKKSAGYKYSGSDNISDVAWHDGNSGSRTHPVKGKKANELGIYDMSGNVWEWCQDLYGPYSGSPQKNPGGSSSGSGRVSRGGSWIFTANYCRVSIRNFYSLVGCYNFLGLRLAL